jgi:hypothetical protein
MPIKKRTNRNFDTPPVEDNGKLNIVAKPKKPLPEQSKLADVYGENPTPAQARRLGLIAMDCGEPNPNARFTVKDRVDLLRTPLDTNNPQEQRYRNRIRNRGTAITAFCITCVGGRKAVTECSATDCPLWAFRFGSDPFYGKKK